MKTKFRSPVVFAAVIAASLLAPAVYAQPAGGEEAEVTEGWPGTGMRHGGVKRDIAGELGLTAEQQEALKARRQEEMGKKKALKEGLRARKSELAQELEKSEIDHVKVNGLIAEIKTLTGQELDQRVEGIVAMKEVLTDEQYAKLQELRKAKKGSRQNMHKSGQRGWNDRSWGGRIRDRMGW